MSLVVAIKYFFQVQIWLQRTGESHIIILFLCRQEVTTLEIENQGQDKKSKSLLQYFSY